MEEKTKELQATLEAIWDCLAVQDQERAEGYLATAVATMVQERQQLRATLEAVWTWTDYTEHTDVYQEVRKVLLSLGVERLQPQEATASSVPTQVAGNTEESRRDE